MARDAKPEQSMMLLLKRLWQHLQPKRRRQFGLLLILMIAASFAEVLSLSAILPFLGVLAAPERVFQHSLTQSLMAILGLSQPEELLLPLTIGFIMAALFSGLMRFALLWAQTRLGHEVGADLSIDIYRRTLYQPYRVHLERNSSEVIAGISTKVNMVVYHVILPTLTILSSILIALCIMAVLIAIDPLVALSTFAGFGSIYVIILLITRKYLARNGQRISLERNRALKALQEGLGGIRDVLIDGTQSFYSALYRNADLPLRRAMASVQIISATPRYGIEAFGLVLVAMLSYFLTQREGGIVGTLPLLGVLAMGAQRLLPTLQQSYASWSLMRGEQGSLADVLVLLDQQLPAYVGHPVVPLPFDSAIRLEGVGFRYPQGNIRVLDAVDLVIPKGGRIGFVGKTGCGKSTLLDVVMGLLQVNEGYSLGDRGRWTSRSLGSSGDRTTQFEGAGGHAGTFPLGAHASIFPKRRCTACYFEG
jgi:ATP-binding cassette subfamily B protein